MAENEGGAVNDGTGSVGAGVDIDTKIDQGNPFLEQIPEDYRDREYLKGIDSMEKFVEQFDNAQKLIGKKTIGVPTPESSIDEWNEFYNKMGRPDAPDAYEFEKVEIPEQFQRTEEDLKIMKQIFHEAGLTAKQAQDVMKRSDEAIAKAFEANKENYEKMAEARNKEFVENMEKHFGEEKDQAIAVAETMLKKYVPKGMEEYVKGLDDNSMLVLSAVLNSVHKSGKTEDSISKDVESIPDETPESLRETARKLMMSPEWKDAFHPNHEVTKNKVSEIYRKIAGA